LKDKPLEYDVDTQTDPLLDRPPTPLFIPKKTGLDVDTQIYPGELFDFDYEVEPILEVLVGKILEQSMMEVMEEEEMDNLRRHQVILVYLFFLLWFVFAMITMAYLLCFHMLSFCC
jgi:radial spoke head protein 3